MLLIATNQFSHAQLAISQTASRFDMCSNYIHISGESNVNQFSFNFNQVELFNNLPPEVSDTGNIIISIPIKDFQASNPMMYHDFLMMLKESEFPRIVICFSRKQLNMSQYGSFNSFPDFRITIAGITRNYKIDCSVFPCAENLFVRGEKRLKLTDFQITPPVKLKGLVKVSDEINVNFGFIINYNNANTLSIKL
jgi:hypothetical protein